MFISDSVKKRPLLEVSAMEEINDAISKISNIQRRLILDEILLDEKLISRMNSLILEGWNISNLLEGYTYKDRSSTYEDLQLKM